MCYAWMYDMLFPPRVLSTREYRYGGRRFLIQWRRACGGVWLSVVEAGGERDIQAVAGPAEWTPGSVRGATLHMDDEEEDVTDIVRRLAGPDGRFGGQMPAHDVLTAVLAAEGGHDPAAMRCLEITHSPAGDGDVTSLWTIVTVGWL